MIYSLKHLPRTSFTQSLNFYFVNSMTSSWAWFITTISQFFLHSIPLISNFLVYFISQLINWLSKHFTLNFKHDGNGNKVKLRVGKFIFVIQMKNVCFLPSTSTRSLFSNANVNFNKKKLRLQMKKGCCWWLFSLFYENQVKIYFQFYYVTNYDH